MPDQRLEQAKRAIQEMAKAERFSVRTPSSSSTPSPAPGSSRSVSQTTPPQQSSSPSLGKSSTAIKRGISTTPKHVRFQDTVSQESIGAEPKIQQQRVEKTCSLDYLQSKGSHAPIFSACPVAKLHKRMQAERDAEWVLVGENDDTVDKDVDTSKLAGQKVEKPEELDEDWVI